MLKKLRIILGLLFLTGITLLFLDFTGTCQPFTGWMAKVQFLPALMAGNIFIVALLVLLTLAFGRVYCSVICPLGIMQDIFAWLGKRKKKLPYKYSPAKNILRYTALGIFVICVLLNISVIVTLMAPYSAYGRIISSLLAPVWDYVNNLMADWSEHAGNYMFYKKDIWMKSALVTCVAVITLFALAVLSWKNGRTYCNTICPVGSILGILSRYSIFRPIIDTSKCVDCGLCARKCKASCIDSKTHSIDLSRCVACMDCIGNCHSKAISFTTVKSRQSAQNDHSFTKATDSARRKFIFLTTTVGAATAIKAQEKKVDGGLAVLADKKIPDRKTPIVPAGAIGLKHFSRHCTACQLCVSACPNDVLRPSTDMTRFMQPEISYERGYCRPECTKCTEVCPNGAIIRISKEEKSSIQTGHAVWIKQNCLPLTDGVECGNCARHCPVGAIHMVPVDGADNTGLKIPVVNEERCIGCGACENLCPVRPFSAIYVEGHIQHHDI